MREQDENAYSFLPSGFAAGMTLGVLLLLASHMGMKKEEIASASFQAEAFLGRKISAKACFSYLLKVQLAPAFAGLLFGLTAIGAYFATAAVWAYGFLCGVFLSAAICRTEWQVLPSFSGSFPQIFLYLAALFLMLLRARMLETNHLAGGMQKKEYFASACATSLH